ncbi:phosphatase PAP2 family protein [Candidatus Neomarinimicrobiota bacterium]
MRKTGLYILIALFATQVALAKGSTAEESSPAGWLGALPGKLWGGTSTSFTHREMRAHWIITGVATLTALTIDQQIMPDRDQLMSNELAHVGNRWGGFWAAVSILPGVYLVDQLSGESPEQRRRNLDYVFSSMVSIGLSTEIIKRVVGRERPNNAASKLSFPSGHTSAAFGFAEVMRNLYGNGPGLVAYGLAVITGVSRVHDNKHHPSDVIAGAGLGIGLARGFFIEQKPGTKIQGHLSQRANMINMSFVF